MGRMAERSRRRGGESGGAGAGETKGGTTGAGESNGLGNGVGGSSEHLREQDVADEQGAERQHRSNHANVNGDGHGGLVPTSKSNDDGLRKRKLSLSDESDGRSDIGRPSFGVLFPGIHVTLNCSERSSHVLLSFCCRCDVSVLVQFKALMQGTA
eukprot:756410-Hanusia_phi.AAC.5